MKFIQRLKTALFIVPTVIAAHPSFAYPVFNKGIYDEDNRRLISELDPLFEKKEINVARSVMAQIPKWRISSEDKSSITIETKALGNGLNFCPDEKFNELPLVSSCSAFLVAPDLILTAGHCVKDKYECQKNVWVLDYNDASGFDESTKNVTFLKDNVFSCSQILSWSQNSKLDYALIKLNKKITDRSPLALRRTGKIEDKEGLFVIGHPMGMPKIFTDHASIRSNALIYTFVTNADTFSGNSGSPVFNAKTQLVEGILIRGDEDFVMDLDFGCNRSYRCRGSECRGETIQRTTVLPLKLIPKI